MAEKPQSRIEDLLMQIKDELSKNVSGTVDVTTEDTSDNN